MLFDDPGEHQLAESSGQQRTGQAWIASDQFVEAVRAGEQVANDVDGPTVTEDFGGREIGQYWP